MPSKKEPPKMLENVLKAIADLKESQGSTVRNIIHKIKSNPERQAGRRSSDITSQVRRALTQGKKAGIIVNNARKYKLTTTPSKCSNLLARSHAAKRRRKSKRKRKGRSTKRRRRRRSDSISVSEASDHPSEASSNQGGDGTVTEANRKRRSRSKKRSKRRSRRRRQQEESCDDGTDDDEDEEETRRKRPRRSESEKETNQQLYQTQQQECDNPDCLCNVRHEADEKRDSDNEDPNTGTLLKY